MLLGRTGGDARALTTRDGGGTGAPARSTAIFDNQWGTLNALETDGFKVNPRRTLATNFDEVWKFIGEWEEKRDTLPSEIDGVGLKVNSTPSQREIGHTGKAPT